VTIKCPKCHSDNTDTARFCSNCATRLGKAGPEQAPLTKTLPTPIPIISKDSLIADKYKIVDEVGAGGMGIVYKAEDLKLKRTVALKFLPLQLPESTELKERFLIEAQAAAALSHPNICVIHEVGETEDRPYIAMEYVEGETVRDRIKKGPLMPEEALDIISQVAAGLAEAHGKSIIHRDIKSANIMVTPKGQAKVMDFGLAKLRGGSSLTKSQTTLGTVAYMSPEQARGSDLDQRTDIWSLGVVLYEMLTGGLPFKGDHDQTVIYSILHGEPKPPSKIQPGLPSGLDEVVLRALAKKAAVRYLTMEEFKADLEAVAEGLKPLKARPTRKIFGIKTVYVYSALAIGLALLIGLNVGGLRNRLLGRAPARSVRLAVLPFANLTGDLQQEFFSDGLTQQMNTQLGGLNPQILSVIGNASVARYKKTNTPIDQIGRDLNVEYVLEGGAQREGTRVLITVELIKTRDQTQVWAESFDRDAASLLTVQSDVVQKVAAALAVKLLPGAEARLAKSRTIDPAAYEAYLKGSQYWIKMMPGDTDTAQHYFELALKIQPDYAAAYTGLAWVWIVRNQMGYSPPSEAAPEAKAAALKAVSLDDALGEAHYALAVVDTFHDWDLPAAGREWQRAVELDPNYPDGLAMYSHYLMIVGRSDEAMTMIKRALQLDPFNITAHAFYVIDLLFARRYDDVLTEARNALAMQPDNNPVLDGLFRAQAAKGMYKECLETLKAYLKLNYQVPDLDVLIDRGFAEGGFQVAMKNAADALAAYATGHSVVPYDMVLLYDCAGDNVRAMEWVERAYEARDPSMPYFSLLVSDPLHADPRFQELMRRMNLPADEKE
jgi:serine/threonine protein kinase/tetratricopeptide (TPR) repeat protein